MIRRQFMRGNLARKRASFCTTSRQRSYEDTISNLKIGSQTRVIFQGFTGKFGKDFDLYFVLILCARKTSMIIRRYA